MNKKERGIFTEFVAGVRSGYEKQDAALRKTNQGKSKTEQIMLETKRGAAETLLSPVKWIFSIFK